jgi:hypothetical protein
VQHVKSKAACALPGFSAAVVLPGGGAGLNGTRGLAFSLAQIPTTGRVEFGIAALRKAGIQTNFSIWKKTHFRPD